jgi:hypothetical protein
VKPGREDVATGGLGQFSAIQALATLDAEIGTFRGHTIAIHGSCQPAEASGGMTDSEMPCRCFRL